MSRVGAAGAQGGNVRFEPPRSSHGIPLGGILPEEVVDMMGSTEWVVVAGGIAAIAWVNWYFLRSASAHAVAGQRVTVVVRGGYDPATIKAAAGKPLTIVFDRQDTSSCSEE